MVRISMLALASPTKVEQAEISFQLMIKTSPVRDPRRGEPF